MEFWLASSDLKQIERVMNSGIFAGVITNPHVVAQSGLPPVELFKTLCSLVPVAWYQLRDSDPETMTAEAQTMLAIDPHRLRIKVPATIAGLSVIARLASRDLDIMATCVPTAAWMCFAVAAGARRVAPYGGMLQKRGIASKSAEVLQMQAILDRQCPGVTLCTGLYDVTDLPHYTLGGVRSFFIWGRDVDAFLNQPLVAEAASAFHPDWTAIAAAGNNS